MINQGSKDGIEEGGSFTVYLTEETKEGPVIFEGVSAKLMVTNVSGSHVSICRVEGADFLIKEGFVVEKQG